MEFTVEEWAKILSDPHGPSREKVLVTGLWSNALRIRKGLWQEHFSAFRGLGFKRGKETNPSYYCEYLF